MLNPDIALKENPAVPSAGCCRQPAVSLLKHISSCQATCLISKPLCYADTPAQAQASGHIARLSTTQVTDYQSFKNHL